MSFSSLFLTLTACPLGEKLTGPSQTALPIPSSLQTTILEPPSPSKGKGKKKARSGTEEEEEEEGEGTEKEREGEEKDEEDEEIDQLEEEEEERPKWRRRLRKRSRSPGEEVADDGSRARKKRKGKAAAEREDQDEGSVEIPDGALIGPPCRRSTRRKSAETGLTTHGHSENSETRRMSAAMKARLADMTSPQRRKVQTQLLAAEDSSQPDLASSAVTAPTAPPTPSTLPPTLPLTSLAPGPTTPVTVSIAKPLVTVEGGPSRDPKASKPRPKARPIKSKAFVPEEMQPTGSETHAPSPPAEPSPVKSKALRRSTATGQVWYSEKREWLLEGMEDLEDWGLLVNAWFEFERRAEFPEVNQGKGLPARGRPKAVGVWVKEGRLHLNPVETADADEFGTELIEWWKSLNPSWRESNEDGEFIQEGSGEWDDLLVKGRNGLLTILACLLWWYDLEEGFGDDTRDAWDAMVADVLFVIDSLIVAEYGDEPSPRRKKRRLASSQ